VKIKDYDISDREKLTLHLVFTLQSPLSHIGETTGNVSNLKTLKVLDFEDNPRTCFVYSGNALRNGVLRRRGTLAAIEELGLYLNPNVHHTLFAGGRIDGPTANNMELDSKIRQLMPWLSILGTAKPAGVFGEKDAQMVPGRANIGRAYLICYESAFYCYQQFKGAIPSDVHALMDELSEAKQGMYADPFSSPSKEATARLNQVKSQTLPVLRQKLKSWMELTTTDQTTRLDSTQEPTLQKVLVANKQLEGEKSSKKSQPKSDRMISQDRLIIPGAKMYARWDIDATEVEIGWLVEAMLKFADSPFLGGKGNRGNGLVTVDMWFQQRQEKGHFMTVNNSPALSAIASQKLDAYKSYLESYKAFLEESKNSKELRGFLEIWGCFLLDGFLTLLCLF